MVPDWFCKISGEKYGPLSPKQLKGMAARGEIAPDDWVKQGADGSWVAASRIKGLFDTTGQSDASPTAQAKPLPVARAAPIPPASADVASPRTSSSPPVARAVPIAAAVPAPQAAVPRAVTPPDAFGIVTDADRPISPSSSPPGSKYTDAKSRKKKQNKIVVGLVALVIGIAVVGVVLIFFVSGQSGEETSKTDTKTPAVEELAEDFSATASAEDELSGEPASAQSSPSTSAPEDTPEGTLVDASKETYYLAPLGVRVESVNVGRPEMRKVDGDDKVVITRPRSEYLIITLELTNTQIKGEAKYISWTSQGTGMLLTDDKDGKYRQIGVPRGRTVIGQIPKANTTIPAGKSVTDVVIFEKPADDIEYLELKLPAGAFRRSGTLRFKIPTEMIGKIEEEAPQQPDPFKELDEKE